MGLYLFWNLVDQRESTELYEEYSALIESIGLSMLKTRLPDSKRFRKELSVKNSAVFRSTLFPIDKTLLKASTVNELIEEIAEIINLDVSPIND